MAKRPGVLEPLRQRVRRFQLIVGAGVLAMVLGSAVFSPLLQAGVTSRLGGPQALRTIVFTLVAQLWAWALLPLILYAFGRLIELRPWRTAAGSVSTGLLFVFALHFISRGTEWLTEGDPLQLITLVLTSTAGVVLGARAILAARAATDRAQQRAKQQAEARKDEYAEFLREAERVAALKDPPAGGEGPGADAPEPKPTE